MWRSSLIYNEWEGKDVPLKNNVSLQESGLNHPREMIAHG